MKKSISNEFKTWLYSGRMPFLSFLIILIFLFGLYGSYKTFMFANNYLLEVENIAIEAGTHDVFIASFKASDIKWGPNDEHLINEFKEAAPQLHAIDPKHSLSYCMEMGYYFFPILLSVFGAFVVKSEMSNGIMRLRVSREGRIDYFVGKQIMLFTLSLVCVIVGIIVAYCFSYILIKYINTQDVFCLFDLNGNEYANMGNSLVSSSFFVSYMLLFLELGFSLALISKSILIPTGIILFVFYILPMYKYTPQNALANIITKICDFQGIVHYSCTELEMTTVFLIISLLLAVPFCLAIFVFWLRSAYK